MRNGHNGYSGRWHLGADTPAPAVKVAGMSDKTRNTVLILGFGLSAALMFATIYPKRQG